MDAVDQLVRHLIADCPDPGDFLRLRRSGLKSWITAYHNICIDQADRAGSNFQVWMK